MPLTTHHLQFAATVLSPLALDAQSGSALRGAVSNALWDRFCTNKAAPTCAACPLIAMCPVAALVAPMRADGEPGGDQRPRPYVVRPPIAEPRTYAPGETLTFGLSMFGSAANLFPYIVLAVQELERGGLGRKLAENRGQRGRLRVEQIAAVNPLTGDQQVLYQAGTHQVQAPGLAITPAAVQSFAATLPTDQITLHFRTPLRLIEQKQLVRQIAFRPLVQRLMRRLDDLAQSYGAGALEIDFRGLLAVAEQVQVADDQTRWEDVVSYSARRQDRTHIGGLLGSATFAGDLAPLRELLVWGSLVHVGKNAVKGDGWYTFTA